MNELLEATIAREEGAEQERIMLFSEERIMYGFAEEVPAQCVSDLYNSITDACADDVRTRYAGGNFRTFRPFREILEVRINDWGISEFSPEEVLNGLAAVYAFRSVWERRKSGALPARFNHIVDDIFIDEIKEHDEIEGHRIAKIRRTVSPVRIGTAPILQATTFANTQEVNAAQARIELARRREARIHRAWQRRGAWLLARPL
jgi:hypothetical protein